MNFAKVGSAKWVWRFYWKIVDKCTINLFNNISNFEIQPLSLASNFLKIMNRIKEVLDEKGIKQTWLAEKLGKSYNMVNSYIQNRSQPRLEVLNQIANVLDVDVKDLLVSSKR